MNNLGEFEKLSDFDKKKQLGTLLYPMIKNILMRNNCGDDLTPKVTGMLIDLEVLGLNDVIDTLQNTALLEERTMEAVELIQAEGNKGEN